MGYKYMKQLKDTTSGEFTIEDYWLAIYRRKGVIFLIVCSAMIFSAIISSVLPPRYEASTTFYVPDNVTLPVDVTGKEAARARLPSGNQDSAKAYAGIFKGADAKKYIHDKFPQKPLKELKRDIDCSVSREGLIKIYVRDKDPALAVALANGMVDYFEEFVRSDIGQQSKRYYDKMAAELITVNNNLEKEKAVKQRLQEKYSISSLKVELEELERNRVKLESDLATKMSDLKPGHPEILALKSGINQSDNRISQILGIITKYERYEENIKQFLEIKTDLEKIKYNLTIGTASQNKIGIVVSSAELPKSPIFPIMWLNVIVAAIFGLLVAMLYSFLLEYLDRESMIRRFGAGAYELQQWATELSIERPSQEMQGGE